MTSAEYDHIENVSWKCCKCNTASYSSSLYQAYNLNVSNSFDAFAGILSDSIFVQEVASPSLFRTIPHRPTVVQLKQPHHSSTIANPIKASSQGSTVPVDDSSVLHHSNQTNNLHIVIANMNSIMEHKAQLPHICATTAPDIIWACETKVDKTIKHTEFLPANYTGHILLDRTNCGGGVMICHRKDLLAHTTSHVPTTRPTSAAPNTRLIASQAHRIVLTPYLRRTSGTMPMLPLCWVEP